MSGCFWDMVTPRLYFLCMEVDQEASKSLSTISNKKFFMVTFAFRILLIFKCYLYFDRSSYGDNKQAKFVFVTYFPENLSQIARARANPHKILVEKFFKVALALCSCHFLHYYRSTIFKSLPQRRRIWMQTSFSQN